jgi:hypothetical protein
LGADGGAVYLNRQVALPWRDRAFSSQVATLGGSENATKQTSNFKPSGYTWLLGKCDQTNNYFQAKWSHLAAQKKRSE